MFSNITSSYFMIVMHIHSSGISQIDHVTAEDILPKYPPWIRFYPSAAPREKPHPRRIYRRISSAVTWSILYLKRFLIRYPADVTPAIVDEHCPSVVSPGIGCIGGPNCKICGRDEETFGQY